MHREARGAKAQYAASCLLAFTIPFPFIFGTISIWILLATWLWGLNFKRRSLEFIRQPGLWLWAVLFTLYACSYFWSTDKNQAVFDSVSKLSFVLLPLCIGTGPRIDRPRMSGLVDALTLGCSATAITCLIQGYLRYKATGSSDPLFYHELVRGFDANAVYMGWYMLVAISGQLLLRREPPQPVWKIAFRAAAVLLLSTFLILLSSRMLLAVFALITMPLYIYRLLRGRAGRSRWAVAVLVITVGFAGTIALTGNPVSKRFRDVMHRDIQVAFLPSYQDTIPHFDNMTLRFFLWRVGLENVREHDLWLSGTGNGDGHTFQNQRFESLGITLDRQHRYNIPINNMNLHNMFMQTLLVVGIPGILLFSAIVIAPFFVLKRSRNAAFFVLFHSCSLLFMLQESALQTQAGVVFYCFFSALFWNAVKNATSGKKLTFQKR